MRHLTETSETLLRGMRAALDGWAARAGTSVEPLYWVLRLQLAETGLEAGASVGDVSGRVPVEDRDGVLKQFRAASAYFDDVRYATLEPVTQVWGTVVNSLRVAADSNLATAGQRSVFTFAPESLVKFFRALRAEAEIADDLYHVFKAMPAPECQALAALLNVQVKDDLDLDTTRRLVRLLDHEGPMSEAEQEDLASLSRTNLVSAAFSGLRSRG